MSLPKEIIGKVRRIEIRTKRLVNDLFGGEYHSTFKGLGMEFDEVREYQPGDDVRSIDWNVTARTGYPHIKKYREERELTVLFVVDASSSGYFGTHERFKAEIAAELCALLAFSAIKNNDKVGMVIFTDRIEKYIPPKKGRGHVLRLIREILYFKPEGRGTDISLALEYVSRVSKRKSVVFLVSDFMDKGYEKPLRIVGRKHDLIALKITDRRELEFEPAGILELEDAETGEVFMADTSSTTFLDQFRRRAENTNRMLKRSFEAFNLDFVQIATDEPYITPLIKFFKGREKRR
ncbi:MAG TPA: DUF58 domain-containing protein [candidate division Zixibacteria bacterium]|nr:DUF58 domain-containing protein [candidate division Zixibacteria bacterium]